MKFALIGGGVVGRCYGQALVQAGIEFLGLIDSQPSEDTFRFADAQARTVHRMPGDWLREADWVVSAVFGSAALDVAQQALRHMRPGSHFVDMTTASPQDTQAASSAADALGVHFVDVAITGAVNLHGPRTPLLMAGKQTSEAAEVFARLGAPIKLVGQRAGDAVALKLLRSIYTKGLEALTIECLTVAHVTGLREPLHDALADLDTMPLATLMETLIVTHVEHAARRRDEVVEAQRLMRDAGIAPIVLKAAQSVFERTAERLKSAPSEKGGGLEASLDWLAQSAGRCDIATPSTTHN